MPTQRTASPPGGDRVLTRLLTTYLQPYRRELGIVVALQLVGTIASLYLPSLNADIIDNGVARGDTSYIVDQGVWMLVVSVLQIACSIVAVWYGTRTAMAFGRDVRSGVFHRVGSFSAQEVARFGAPSLITRTTNDVQQVQVLVVMLTTMFVAAPIMSVAGVVMALREDVGLSWLLLVCVPVLAIAIGMITVRMVPLFRRQQERIDHVNRVLREQLTGVRVVRAFVREKSETERFADANAQLTDIALRAGRLQAMIFPTVMLIFNVSSVAVLWFGAHRVADGEMQVGALTAFLAYLLQILMSVMMASFVSTMVPRASVSAGRIMEVINTEPSVHAPAEPVPAPAGIGQVSFHSAEFRYPGADAPVLRNTSFTVGAGRTTAIIGSTGSGKTTLMSLIPRLIDVTAGEVRVGGVDVRAQDPGALRSRIGLVPQVSYLFTGTVRSNLSHGAPDATDERMWTALDIAQSRDFVTAMGGLDAKITQGGTNLSGGQRQRLSIARALVRRPDVYLFDDSFSALDLATDAALRAALKPYTRDAAVIVVAQRVSTVAQADQILVLENGEIVGRGTHRELMDSCPTYLEIVHSQLTPEEAS